MQVVSGNINLLESRALQLKSGCVCGRMGRCQTRDRRFLILSMELRGRKTVPQPLLNWPCEADFAELTRPINENITLKPESGRDWRPSIEQASLRVPISFYRRNS